MPYSNMPFMARPYPIALFLKRCAVAAFASLFLASCASKPKSISSTDAYTVNAVTVSSTASDSQFKSALEEALSGAFSGKGDGLESDLNVTVTNVRIGANLTSVFYGATNAATMHVVVRSSKTGLKLRDFKFSVTSNATDAERARTQMAEKARNRLTQIFKIRLRPAVVAKQRDKALAAAKKKAKPISLDPIGDLERKVENKEAETVTDALEKPKLIPIAEALPESEKTPVINQNIGQEAAAPVIVAPTEPKSEVSKPASAIETPSSDTKPSATVAPTPKAEVVTPKEDDVLCVVTLENDCSN